MKKYILFVSNLSGIGGAQLYILRKAKYLVENQYNVYIVVGSGSCIEHKELEIYPIIEVKELLYAINIFSKKKISTVIHRVLKFINYDDSDEIYIESHPTSPSLWAEKFAYETKSVNFVYGIGPFCMKRKSYKDFFEDKLEKRLFIGCNKSFIKNNFPSIKNSVYFNIPFDKDEIAIVKKSPSKNEKYHLNILTISRIDKTYIKASIIEISKFAKEHKNINIKYEIYVSVKKGNKYDELLRVVNENISTNLIIKLKGPVNPLNSDMFDNQDLFIGMGTAVLNSSSMKLPTLVVDYRNNKYYGFFGIEHFEFGTTNVLASETLSKYLEYFLNNIEKKRYLGEKAFNLFNTEYENNTVNSKFVEYMKKHSIENVERTNIQTGIFDMLDLYDYCSINILGINRSISIKRFIIDIMQKNKNHI